MVDLQPDTSADEWEKLGPASFTVPGRQIVEFVITKIQQSGGNRLPKRTRPHRAGVKLDSTGRKERTYQFDIVFHNDVTEDLNTGADFDQMWPDRAYTFRELLETGDKVGTLHTPWERNIKCRCESYTKTADAERDRGGERFNVTFIEDNEENLADNVKLASVKSSVASAVDSVNFAAESEGIFNTGLEDLTTLASQLVTLINAPGEYLEQILTTARSLERSAVGIKNALTTNLEGSNQLQDPAGSSLFDALTEVQDMAGRVAGEAASRFPATRTMRYRKDRTIDDIATELGQNARDLIAVNSGLEDPAYIPAGTPVQVFV